MSQYDLQEVRNAVDQTSREVRTRYDFKDTGSGVELLDRTIQLESSTEDRLSAVILVLEERLVHRKVSLKTLDWETVEQAGGGRYRRTARLKAGISSDDCRAINRLIKDLGIKGVQSQVQGDQIRVSGKKRDSLQEVIGALRSAELDLPLQFTNFRD